MVARSASTRSIELVETTTGPRQAHASRPNTMLLPAPMMATMSEASGQSGSVALISASRCHGRSLRPARSIAARMAIRRHGFDAVMV